jgi:hypothetical protein
MVYSKTNIRLLLINRPIANIFFLHHLTVYCSVTEENKRGEWGIPYFGQEVIVRIWSGSDFSGYWIKTISLPYGVFLVMTGKRTLG